MVIVNMANFIAVEKIHLVIASTIIHIIMYSRRRRKEEGRSYKAFQRGPGLELSYVCERDYLL
jgi:hypothetical protein